jgi:hypothetical protein
MFGPADEVKDRLTATAKRRRCAPSLSSPDGRTNHSIMTVEGRDCSGGYRIQSSRYPLIPAQAGIQVIGRGVSGLASTIQVKSGSRLSPG